MMVCRGWLFSCSLMLASAALQSAVCAYPLSTNRDGSLQAVTQGPSSIWVYWRQSGGNERILVDSAEWQNVEYSLDKNTGFACARVNGLEPNRRYSFSTADGSAVISEKTPHALPDRMDCDLLVLGAKASGTAAAITAARLGLKVVLVEDTNRLGGMASEGLGSTDIRNMATANGIFDDFRQRVMQFYGTGDGRFYEPRVANAIFKEMVYAHPNITLFLKCSAVKPIMVGKSVVGAVVRDNAAGRTGEIRARVVIDATYEADFAAACGARYMTGREPRTPDEPHAGVIYFDNANQAVLPGSTGRGDKKQQSYSYLMVLRDYGEKEAPQIEKPPYYDPETYRHSPDWMKTWNYLYGRLPGGKFEINQHPFGTDWPGINHDYAEASPKRRQEIADMNRWRALGYLYFLQNERGHRNLGLADSEFMDSGNFPQQLYVREVRRVAGEYLFKESDVTNARAILRPDSIAIGDYPMDSHAVEDLKDPTRVDKGEGEAWLRSFTPWYQVPPGVLIPKDIDGLIVSTAVSGTHIGYGTLRMEPVRMSLGQAAGAIAYLSVLYSVPPRRVKPAWIQDKILSQFAYVTWYSDVTRETRHFKAIQFLGARGAFPGEKFRPDELMTRREAIAATDGLLMLETGRVRTAARPVEPLDEPVSRGEFAVWLAQAKVEAGTWELVEPPAPTYADVPKDSPYYAAVETLAAHRITAALFESTEMGYFKPDEPISRADAAQAIYLAHRDFAMR